MAPGPAHPRGPLVYANIEPNTTTATTTTAIAMLPKRRVTAAYHGNFKYSQMPFMDKPIYCNRGMVPPYFLCPPLRRNLKTFDYRPAKDAIVDGL
ncbi:hypothetical protein MSG28_008110 [Choristoneura fumiferana]|uniref:Uncharacterized protein n=1 Tax=Choristoneura fumiferana TaxID=7141 RepID=A0ACC0JA50_CHOFU|nr:hypothetical protein MSG28_008110 [Choristoneura fumiferana]